MFVVFEFAQVSRRENVLFSTPFRAMNMRSVNDLMQPSPLESLKPLEGPGPAAPLNALVQGMQGQLESEHMQQLEDGPAIVSNCVPERSFSQSHRHCHSSIMDLEEEDSQNFLEHPELGQGDQQGHQGNTSDGGQCENSFYRVIGSNLNNHKFVGFQPQSFHMMVQPMSVLATMPMWLLDAHDKEYVVVHPSATGPQGATFLAGQAGPLCDFQTTCVWKQDSSEVGSNCRALLYPTKNCQTETEISIPQQHQQQHRSLGLRLPLDCTSHCRTVLLCNLVAIPT